MAKRQDITARADRPWFVGEDKILLLEILQEDEATPEDVTGQALEWVARLNAADPDPPLIRKTTGDGSVTIIGVYNAVRAVNTQRVRIAVPSADTVALTPSAAIAPPQMYKHACRRTDVGSRGVYAYGDLELLQAAAH